jgi:hypothetical protein
MTTLAITDQLLNRAFELAYFILGDRSAAIYVATAAVDKLKAASTVQGRRQYYTPTGRAAYPATRTKVSLSDLHLLQRLIYIESDLFERLLEGQPRANQPEDLLIRYVKHLVRITTRHNSFYVALGLCRLLYNYTTAETSEIYNFVLQDPARMRDDHYYRSRKKRLMEEMKDRFGDLIRAERGFRREERFLTQDPAADSEQLVKECLARFTPWESACVLPIDLDPKRSLVPPLLFEGDEPDKEHAIELSRIHTLTHPECFARLAMALNLDAPEQRLAVPQFFTSTDEVPPSADRFRPSELSEGELDAIKHHLEKNSARRRTFAPGELICLVDQKRMAVLATQRTSKVSFGIGEEADVLEIRSGAQGEEEEIPLALWRIHQEPAFSHRPSTLLFESGEKLTFQIDPPIYDSDGPMLATATISFADVAASAGAESVRGLWWWRERLRNFATPILLWPALAIVLLAVFGVGWWKYVRVKRAVVAPASSAQTQSGKPQNSLAPQPTQSTSPDVNPPSEHIARQSKPGPAPQTPPPPANADESPDETRGNRLRPNAIALASVKRIQVDPLGEDSLSRQLRQSLIEKLEATGRFTVVTNRTDADAVFQGSIGSGTNRSSTVKLDLVDRSGKVIWSFAHPTVRRVSNAQETAAQIVKALLKDIPKAQ